MSYQGLGEPLCFISFGPLATTAFYLCLAGPLPVSFTPLAVRHALALVPPLVWTLASIVGATTSAVLLCSHFHQTAGDARAGKRSPVVRLGTFAAARALAGLTAGCYAALAALVTLRQAPPRLLLASFLSIPLAGKMLALVLSAHNDPERVRVSKFLALRWHAAMAAAMALGLCV